MLDFVDNLFTKEEIQNNFSYFLSKKFSYGESDAYTANTLSTIKNISPTIYMINNSLNMLPTGLVHEFNYEDDRVNFMIERIEKYYSSLKDKKIFRIYLNFFNKEIPYFHIDGNCQTVIVYLNDFFNVEEHGETIFLNEETMTTTGILPVPGRVCLFDGNLKHRASSFRNYPRLNIVFKYEK